VTVIECLRGLVTAVRTLDPATELTKNDFRPYAEGLAVNRLWGMYAQSHWQDERGDMEETST
jgi:hypothetical protein